MKSIRIELDDDTAEKVAALIDDSRPTLEACATQILVEAARARDQQLGLRMCECAIMHRAADDPEHPVEFDAELNEFNIRHGRSLARIYYCYSCGGRAPASKRQNKFVHVPPAEYRRLGELCEKIDSITGAIERFGLPDRDSGQGLMVTQPDEAQTTTFGRVAIYSKLSDVADVAFTEFEGARATKSFRAKSISASPSG